MTYYDDFHANPADDDFSDLVIPYFTPPTGPPEIAGSQGSQRWRSGRSTYRPPTESERIDPSEYEVVSLPERKEAYEFVRAHHYAHQVPPTRFSHGLLWNDLLVGVALYTVPQREAVLSSVFPGGSDEAIELGRFILYESVKRNAESWFLARSLELLKQEGMRGVVSFSDPTEWADAAGNIVKPGHVGTIYQATNAVYLGQTRHDRAWLMPDGTVFGARKISKIRAGEKGWDYAVTDLVGYGAKAPLSLRRGEADVDELGPWVKKWLAKIGRRISTLGKHKYAFPLYGEKERRRLRYQGETVNEPTFPEERIQYPKLR